MKKRHPKTKSERGVYQGFVVSFELLSALLADDNKFGFIVMDGNGCLFGTLQGNTREVLNKFTVDLPKKHGTFCDWKFNVEQVKPCGWHRLNRSIA